VYNLGSLENFLKKTGSNFLISEIWNIFPKISKITGIHLGKIKFSKLSQFFGWKTTTIVGEINTKQTHKV
jgi:hypothetical protein